MLFLAGKNVEICDFRQKKPSDFGEDLFFWRSPGFGRKICDFGQKKPSEIGEDLFLFFFFLRSPAFGRKKTLKFRPEKAFGNRRKPLPPRSREAGDAPGWSPQRSIDFRLFFAKITLILGLY